VLAHDWDGYECSELMGELRNPKVRIVRLGAPWAYVGAVHELLEYPGALVKALPELAIRNLRDGAGSEQPAAERYASEAALLSKSLEANPLDSRSQFYLGQSLELAGDLDGALQAYTARAAMLHGFVEEAWMSLVRIAGIYARFEPAAPLVDGAYWAAWNRRRTRGEPLVALARWHRMRGEPHLSLIAARLAASLPLPDSDRLFVEASAHAGGWQVMDELALALHGTGRHEQALAAGEAAINVAPLHEQEHLRATVEFYRAAAGTQTSSTQ
jgi:tetratricopeptide (TPR) repeat protein